MRDTLQTRAADFTQAFDRELTQIYIAFHSEPDLADGDPARALGAELARAQASATVAGLIKEVFLLEAQGKDAGVLRRFHARTRRPQPPGGAPALPPRSPRAAAPPAAAPRGR